MNNNEKKPPVIDIIDDGSNLPDMNRINNPRNFEFLQRHGTWNFSMGQLGTLYSRAGRSSKAIPVALVDFSLSRGNLVGETARMIESAPKMASLLDTVQQWGPTIIKKMTPLEREIMLDVLRDIYQCLDYVGGTQS